MAASLQRLIYSGHVHTAQDVKALAWHPSGEVLVSASYDDSIRLWVDSGDEWECAQTLSGTAVPCLRPRVTCLLGSYTADHEAPTATVLRFAVATVGRLEVVRRTCLCAMQAQGSDTARQCGM